MRAGGPAWAALAVLALAAAGAPQGWDAALPETPPKEITLADLPRACRALVQP